jgi:hypothetical protein
MSKTRFAILVLALFALPSFARDAHQSYVSYDDGQAILRQEDGREVDVRVNLPVFPGDEVETGRRGRTEIRLADGNIVTVDRGSAVRFRSILDSYEGESSQTVAELIFGVAIFHDLRGDESIRVDTRNATYVSGAESLFSIETASSGIDQVAVFNGSVEIRTPNGTDRLRAGERAEVDQGGPHSVTTAASYGGTDFERWYIRRAERYGRTSRYLDRRVAYADDDLDGYGRWIYVSDYDSWAWRPYVSAGWRPYHYGRWHHRYGSLVWHSFEPWGWVPYHYGRWGFSPVYGWIWIPGAAYSHAWVYWAFGPSYLGWIPAGFYDCYRPYYNWAYRPYVRTGIEVGFGFHGRIKLSNIDYRAWTFIDPDTLLSTRVDRAALTTDAIRDRLIRDGDQATVANVLPKLRSEDLKNPSSAIGVIHRGAGGGTGKDGSGSLADVTPFFRRDPELPDSVRDRIVRPGDRATVDRGTQQGSTAGPGRVDRGAPSSGQTGPRDGGGIVPRQPVVTTSPRRQESGPQDRVIGRRPAGESSAPRDGEREGGVVTRRPPATAPGGERENRSGGIVPRGGGSRSDAAGPRGGDWRDRVMERDAPRAPRSTPSDASSPRWREGGGEVPRAARPRSGESAGESGTRYSAPRESGARDDVPRRVIDRIGGARLEPRDRSSGRSGDGGSARSSGRESSAPQRVDRPSTPPRSSSSPRSSSPPPKRESSGSSKSEGSRSSNIKPKG